MKKEELNKHIASWDSEKWKEEVKSKTSLDIYRRWKQKVKEEDVYDNTTASVVLFQARTNTLPLNSRKRFTKESTKCDLCQGENEDLRHFLLECTGLSDIRKRNLALQQPYNQYDALIGDGRAGEEAPSFEGGVHVRTCRCTPHLTCVSLSSNGSLATHQV